jgi:hypothetical protein
MRAMDKLIAGGVAALVLAGAVWLLLVSPERHQASALSAQIASENAALSSAQSSLASARAAVAGYPGDVRALAQVTAGVPTSVDEPTVITTITQLAGTKVNFKTIGVGASGGTAQGPSSLGLTFSFSATYASLQSFLARLDQLLVTNGTSFVAHGRLFTVSGVSLAPAEHGGTTVTVTADAYFQPVASASATDTATSGGDQ